MALQSRQLLLLYVVVFMYAACFMAQVGGGGVGWGGSSWVRI
jgi:hypothetical protein